MKFWVGTTDADWFRFLSGRRLDEVNFWQPTASPPFKGAEVGMPFLFKLKKPFNHIAGGGFFVGHSAIPFSLAWDIFGEKNGASSIADLGDRLRSLRHGRTDPLQSIGCQVISWPTFLPPELWLEDPPGWAPNIVRGRMYDSSEESGAAIWSRIGAHLSLRAGSVDAYTPPPRPGLFVESPEATRYGAEQAIRPRLGQGAFRLLLTDLYKRRCAITGESTLPTLEAAHIVPYGQSGTHDVRNGLLLRADFHKLFDLGLIGLSPSMRIQVSPRIRDAWFNGKAYYRVDGQPLAVLPDEPAHRPDPELLDWHIRNIYQG
jgi:putative restriction endonuclease